MTLSTGNGAGPNAAWEKLHFRSPTSLFAEGVLGMGAEFKQAHGAPFVSSFVLSSRKSPYASKQFICIWQPFEGS